MFLIIIMTIIIMNIINIIIIIISDKNVSNEVVTTLTMTESTQRQYEDKRKRTVDISTRLPTTKQLFSEILLNNSTSKQETQPTYSMLASYPQPESVATENMKQTNEGIIRTSTVEYPNSYTTHIIDEDNNYNCSTVQCQNGGTCVAKAGGYSCICAPQYQGIRCEIGKWQQYFN